MGITERKEREREARRTTILDAAEAIFKDRGFTNATMDDIARHAELAKGTVYLYYRSKEELQLGLLSRGIDTLHDAFEQGMADKSTAIERMLTVGATYWQFAEEHQFYFELMHLVDMPNKTAQVSPEAVSMLHEKSSGIWSLLVTQMEQAKIEGTIKPEVNSLAFTIMLWMNATGVLRFHHRIRATPESVWSERGDEFDMCKMNWREIYQLNGNLLLHELVTARGLMYLTPIEWPTSGGGLMPCLPNGLHSHAFDSQHSPFQLIHNIGGVDLSRFEQFSDESNATQPSTHVPIGFYETGV